MWIQSLGLPAVLVFLVLDLVARPTYRPLEGALGGAAFDAIACEALRRGHNLPRSGHLAARRRAIVASPRKHQE